MELKSYVWNTEEECTPPQQRRELQNRHFSSVVNRLYENARWYRRKMELAALAPRDVSSLEDISKLPFTTKDELRSLYPFGLIMLPLNRVSRFHTSTGTTGKPTVVGYTQEDLEIWSECVARTLAASGIRSSTLVQNAYGYGLATGGLGFHRGIEKLGASLIPASNAPPKKQLELLGDFGAQALLCTPSFASTLIDVAQENDMSLKNMPLQVGVFGGENCSLALKTRLEESLAIKAYDTYGLSEIIGPGVAHECPSNGGLHIYEDHFIAEIIDFKSGAVLPEGQEGELVLSSITRTASPLLRYRTGDKARFITQACECPRTFRRISRVVGRASQLIRVGDQEIHPYEIEEKLLAIPEIGSHYQIMLDSKNFLTIQIEQSRSLSYQKFSEKILQKKIQEGLNKVLLETNYCVKLVSTGLIPRSQGKAERVIWA